jgi:SSS family solute:Na+ symporter/sodium/pantothenate symporter
MSVATIVILVLMIAYAVIVLGIGQYAYRQTGSGRRDYYVAAGTLSPFVIFFTYLATYISTYGFVGLSAVFYSWGIEWAWFEAMYYPTLIIPLTILIGLRLYKLGKMHNYVTNADLVAHRLGSEGPVRVFFGLIMILFPSIFYVGIQFVAMSAILSGLTGGQLSYGFMLLFFASTMALYVILGGMRSVAYTDVVQGITVLLALGLSALLVYTHWGGFGEMFVAAATGPRAWAFERTLPPHYFYPAILFIGPAWAGLVPHLWVRFYAAKDIRAVLMAGLGVGIGGALMYALLPVLVGTALLAFYPEAPEVAVTEQYVSMMFSSWFGAVPAALLMFGLVAAGKSTADSILLNLSSILQVDILEKTFNMKSVSNRQVCEITACCCH